MGARFVPNPAEIDLYLQTNPELAAELLAHAEKIAGRAKGIAEAEFHNSRTHTLKGGHINEPGDYANGIKGSVVHGRHAEMRGRVTAHDFKSHWIEYGTKKWPKHGVLRKAMDGES